jgi:hypothetical protein
MTLDNFKVDSLTLMAGAPIAVHEYSMIIRQPKVEEIALIGEKKFFTYLSYFKIKNKDFLASMVKDKSPEEVQSIITNFFGKNDFDIFVMLCLNDFLFKYGVEIILNLIIQDFNGIEKDEENIKIIYSSGHESIITNDQFLIIREIINTIFCLDGMDKKGKGAANAMAAEIQEKLDERKRKLEALGVGESESQSIISNLISILTVGSNSINMDDILKMTVYQLFNVMKRFGLYQQYQSQMQAMLAGASDIELVDWLQEI